jgi:hypothetical protein
MESGGAAEGTEKKSDCHVELFRFIIAAILICGFLIILGISVLTKYPDPLVLSGIFSGWIVSILGFYFMQQNVDKANQKTIQTIEESSKKLKTYESQVEDLLDSTGSHTKKTEPIDMTHEFEEYNKELKRRLKEISRRLE